MFIREAPPHVLSVIQAAPTASTTKLSLLATKDLKVSLRITGGKADRSEFNLSANEPVTVHVTGIKPDTAPAYTAVWDGGRVTGTLRTPRRKGQPFTFVVQADSHLDENSAAEVYARAVNAMGADRPDFMIDLGDTFMTGKHSEYAKAISQYRVQRYYMSQVEAPVFLALGNHDGETGWIERGQTGMTQWARQQREAHFPSPVPNQKGLYYAVEWGDVLALVLDPFSFTPSKPGRNGDNWTWTLGRAQYDWLKATLEKTSAKYRLVFIHHLVGGSGKDARGGAEASAGFEWGGVADFGAKRPGWGETIHEMLKKHKVQGVFRGHDHIYVRQERDGIIYQCLAQPSHARGDSVRSAAEYGYLSGKILGSSGYQRFSIGADGLKVEYVKLTPGGTTVADSYVLPPVK